MSDRKHGIDLSIYRLLLEGAQDKSDFAMVCAVWGTWPLPNWEKNAAILKKFHRRIAYGAYRADVGGALQAQYLMDLADEADAQGLVIDYESYGTYKLGAADIPRLKEIYFTIEAADIPVAVYMGRYRLWEIEQYDPVFAAHMNVWLAYYSTDPTYEIPETIDNYGSYADKIDKPFEELVAVQRTTRLDGTDYGVNFTSPEDRSKDSGDPATTLDGNISWRIDEWLGVVEQPPEEPGEEPDMGILEQMQAEIAELKDMLIEVKELQPLILRNVRLIRDQLEGGAEPEPEPEPDTIGKTVDRDGANVFLFFVSGYNLKDAPVFQIYPKDTSEVKDRLWVASGTTVQVFADGRTVGDSGTVAWKVDKAQLVASGAPVPDGVDLYVLEKFIV